MYDAVVIFKNNNNEQGSTARWFELAGGQVAFYLTKNTVLPAQFETNWATVQTPTSDPRWGRSYALWQQKDSERVLPVTVDPIFFSAVGVMPRRVKLYIEYFQITPGKKRLVLAQMQFFELCYTNAATPEQTVILEKVRHSMHFFLHF